MELYKKPIVSNRTYTKYETTLNSIKQYCNEHLITDYTKKTYQQILNKYAETHSPASTSKFNNHIRQCVSNAVEEKIILDNFTNKAVISGTNNTKKAEDKFLNYEDTKQVIAYFKERLDPKIPSYLMIIIAFTTGMRYGELLGLTWEDIDLDNQEIDINKSYDYHTHSGFKATKTYSSCRTIFIDSKTTTLLKQFYEDQQRLFEQYEVTNLYNQVFFHYIEGIVSNNAVNQSLRRALKKLEITPLITMHGARHTYGSFLIYKGVDLTVLSEILGHKDTSITSRVYVHVIKEMREKNKTLINNITYEIYK
ncbi:site-specific integrase [Psychrobacillus psychrodurans]|nr:site-specific integrase [Psychrobacillus psychrodurans]